MTRRLTLQALRSGKAAVRPSLKGRVAAAFSLPAFRRSEQLAGEVDENPSFRDNGHHVCSSGRAAGLRRAIGPAFGRGDDRGGCGRKARPENRLPQADRHGAARHRKGTGLFPISEERRLALEMVCRLRSGWSLYNYNKKNKQT